MKVYIANFKIFFCTLLLICGAASVANAQEFRFSAAVSSNTIGTDELVRIQFMIENPPQNTTDFKPPVFNGFTVIQGPSQMQGSSFVNGKGTTYVAVSYVLQPTAVGSFTIPAASLRVDGKIVKSNPVNITVVKGGAGSQMPQQQPQQQPQQGFPRREAQPGVVQPGEDIKAKLRKNLFVKVEVDKTTLYQGEQLTATYKLYTRLPTNSSVTKVPAFKGFSARDIELPNPPQASEEIVNGVPFKVFIIRKTLLFPLQSGELELDAAEVDNQVHLVNVSKRKRGRNSPFDDPFFRDAFGNSPFDDEFFDDAFNNPQYEVFPYKIQSPVVKVTVKPLPVAGRPASFNGAVGKFQMTATADKSDLSTDDAVTLKVAITGQGNVNLLNAPPLPQIPAAFEKYDPSVSDNIEKNSNPLSGTRQFQYVLMPQEKGDFTLPAVEFSYFDPVANAYKTLTSAAFPLHVVAGKLAKREKEDFGGSTDLADIRTTGQHWSKRSPFFFGKPLFWALLILPVFAFGGMAVYRRQQVFRESNVAMLRHKHANKVALKRLELAARYLKEGKDKAFYEETSRGVWGYLSHKLKIPMAELNKQIVQERLQQMQVKSTTIQQLLELTERCEMALYAPSSSNETRQGAYQEAVQVISSLEDELKGRA